MKYVNQIKTTIQETYAEYKNDESVNPSLLWETIKLNCARNRTATLKSKRNRPNNAKNMSNKQLPDYKGNLATKLLVAAFFTLRAATKRK